MKYLLTLAGCCLLILTFAANGCKNNPTSVADNIQSAEDNATAENEFASVFEMVDNDATQNPTFGKVAANSDLLPDCTHRSVDTAARTVTFDFGSTNCLCKDGIYRRGKIVAAFTGKYKEAGSKAVIYLTNYFVNDNQVQGTKTIERTSDSSYTVTVTGASVTTIDGTISWNANRIITRTAGNSTLTPWDDVYQCTGSASGTNRKGEAFTVTIDQPLVKRVQLGCPNFVSGILTVKSAGSTMTLNYDPIGGALCDKVAEITINGTAHRIILR